MNIFAMLPHQSNATVNQDCAEDVHDPVKALEQRDTGKDKRGAHDDRAHHAPRQHSALMLLRYREVAEDQKEDEQVVDAERLLDDVAGEKLQGQLGVRPRGMRHQMMPEEVDQDSERAGQSDPKSRPAQRFAKSDDMTLALEYAQVERQHHYYEQIEDEPERPVSVHAPGSETAGTHILSALRSLTFASGFNRAEIFALLLRPKANSEWRI